jgi:FemAB-related protein (PEP-CTERM system-associated)
MLILYSIKMDCYFNDYFLSVIKQALRAQLYQVKDQNLSCDLVLVKSLLFGNRLISLGYLTDGGIVGDAQQSQEKILAEIKKIANQHKVDYVEFRGGIKPNTDQLIIRDHIYANFTKNMANIDDILLSIPRKKRADIRKAVNNTALQCVDNVRVNDFYALFSKSQHLHGTPIHSKKYYQTLCDNSDYAQIYGVRHNHKLVATCIVFITGNELIAYYGAADKDYVKSHVYDLLYYYLMQIAKQKQLVFNFGRSKHETGSFKYKTLWGFEPYETTHYIMPISNKPIADLRANNPKFSRKIALWRRLPLWLANLIGPYILRQIG